MTSTLSQVGELILESRIGVGFTAEVYKGIWTRRGDTVPRRGVATGTGDRGPVEGRGVENPGETLGKNGEIQKTVKILEKSWETSKHLEKWYGRVSKKENSQW